MVLVFERDEERTECKISVIGLDIRTSELSGIFGKYVVLCMLRDVCGKAYCCR